MATYETSTASALLDRLRGDEEASRAAWSTMLERLHAEPEAHAEALCEAVLTALEDDLDLAVRSAILPGVEAATRDRPELVSRDMLQRLLEQAGKLDTLSVLCTAAMRVRVDAEGFITDGIQEVLAATEHALVTHDDPSLRDVQEYAREVAYDVWETVADRDPAALVVALEFWAAAAGWDRPASRLLAELLLRAAPHRPDVRDATLDALEATRSAVPADSAHSPQLERILDELYRLRERARRRRVAERIVAELRPEPPSPELPDPGAATPVQDPDASRWIEDYLSDDPERAQRAHERLGPHNGDPEPAMVAGVVGALEELLGADPRDERAGPLLDFLCSTAERRPDLVPGDVLERCTRVDGLEEWERAMAFATLARVRPASVLGHLAADAIGTAVVVGGGLGSAILGGVGRADPAFLLAFARRWLEAEGWTEEVGPALACAFEQVASERPQQSAAMIGLLREHTTIPPRDAAGLPTEFTRCLERLARVAAGDGT